MGIENSEISNQLGTETSREREIEKIVTNNKELSEVLNCLLWKYLLMNCSSCKFVFSGGLGNNLRIDFVAV